MVCRYVLRCVGSVGIVMPSCRQCGVVSIELFGGILVLNGSTKLVLEFIESLTRVETYFCEEPGAGFSIDLWMNNGSDAKELIRFVINDVMDGSTVHRGWRSKVRGYTLVGAAFHC